MDMNSEERNVTIRIKDPDGSEPVLILPGKLLRIGNSWNVRYGQDGALYTIGISDGIVSVSREGEEEYAIILQEGKEHPFGISTPYGSIEMRVVPERVFIEERETGLKLELEYFIVGSGKASDKFCLFLDCEYDD